MTDLKGDPLTWAYRPHFWDIALSVVAALNLTLPKQKHLGTNMVRRAAVAMYRQRANGREAVFKAAVGALEPEYERALGRHPLELAEW